MSHFSTVVLYIFVIIWAVFWGRIAQKKRAVRKGLQIVTCTSIFKLVIALVVPWFILAFTNIGVDYEHYYDIIYKVTWYDYADYFTWEPFFLLMSVFFKTICNGNPDLVIFIYKTITVFLIGTSMYLLRNEVRLWLSIMVYMMLFYFGSFYLIAMCLASSIVSLAVILWLKNGKLIIPLAMIILAAQIHNAMYMFLPLFILAVYFSKSANSNNIKLFIITISFLAAGILAMTIFRWAINNIESFHYSAYTDVSNEGSGLMFFIRFGTLFLLMYLYSKINFEYSDKFRFFIIFALGSALFYNMAYTFRVIGRMDFSLISLYYFFFPYMYSKTIDKSRLYKTYMYQNINLLCFVFLFLLGFDEVSGRIVDKFSPGLGHWTFFMPF